MFEMGVVILKALCQRTLETTGMITTNLQYGINLNLPTPSTVYIKKLFNILL